MFWAVVLAARRTIGLVAADSVRMSQLSLTRVPPSTGSSW